MSGIDNITDEDLDLYVPTLERWQGIVYCLARSCCIILSLFVQRSIFKLLIRREGRLINGLIIMQQIVVTVFLLLYATYTMAAAIYYPLKDIIGTVGCHVIDGMEIFGVLSLQTASFWLSLFRYICIVHHEKLQTTGISPKVLQRIILAAQFIGPSLHILAKRINGVDDYRMAKTLYKCLGKYELSFDQDLDDNVQPDGYMSCPSVTTVPLFSSIFCRTSSFVVYLMSSNLIEIYLLAKCFQLSKKQTESMKSLLSLETFETRKREEGVMLKISIWQWILEVAFLVFFYICLYLLNGRSKILDYYALLVTQIFSAILNGFYLLGDRTFQRHYNSKGFLKALWRAFLQ